MLLKLLGNYGTTPTAKCQTKHYTWGVNALVHMQALMSCPTSTHTPVRRLPFGHAAVLFLILAGPRLGNSPVPSIVQCLARKDGSDDFYQLKVS